MISIMRTSSWSEGWKSGRLTSGRDEIDFHQSPGLLLEKTVTVTVTLEGTRGGFRVPRGKNEEPKRVQGAAGAWDGLGRQGCEEVRCGGGEAVSQSRPLQLALRDSK
ncbi:hypothetical protein CPLU01_02273 [Colletotrichum plurivorum]|uniref:Uncharacterized protein n=1 Tax=Colletotrichum plurivorum TaxID=2175906 RepID=A0A8H6KWS1_9PEZI|nr:hypothetical protein CPLU01_02273 [Colletotrichum plurivorum]